MNKSAFAVRHLIPGSRMSAVALAAATVALSSSAFAADKAWSTAPASNAFSGTNWSAGQAAGAANTTVASGDNLFFGISSQLFPNNDLSGFSFGGITFNTGASAFTIGGNTFTLTGNLVNNSTAVEVFNNTIALSQNTTIAANTGAVTLNGAINAGTFGLTKIGTGVLNLNSVNNFSGGTTVTGILFGGVTGAFGTGGITVNAATGNQLSLGAGVSVANNITVAGGGAVGQSVIYVPTNGTSTVTGNITVNGAQNSGGIFATASNTAILNIAGDNTITSTSAPITIRAGRVVYSGAQSYTTGTVFGTADARASLQFSKIVSMPASGTVSVAQGNSIIVNAGGAGEFTSGAGTTTAGTIGGLLGGVGGQGAPVTLAAGSTLGIDTTNATAPIVFNAPFQTSTNSSAGLLKLGAGTLELSAGGVYAGSGGTTGFPLVARAGVLTLSGGTNTVTGEMVVGGNFGQVAGTTGQDATINVTNGTILNVSGYLSVGRGNGIGVANSALNVDNGTITAGNYSLGFNVAAGNLPKASMTLNNASTLTIGTTASVNPNFNFAESLGSTGTLTMNGTSAISIPSATAIVHLGNTGTATINMNDSASITSGNNNANFFIGRVAGGRSTVTMNGSSSITLTGAAAGITLADGGVGVLNVASPAAKVSSNALLIGHFGTTTGVLYNKGSLLNLANGIFMGDGIGGYAYLRNDNGAAVTPNATAGSIVSGISSNSYGVVDVVSGTLSGTRAGTGFFQAVAANGQYNVLGGNLAVGAGGLLNSDGATGAKSMSVNVSGTGTLNVAGAINLGGNTDAGTQGFLSLRTGGVVVADTINATVTTGTGTAAITTVSANPFTAISANGGTLRASTSVATASASLVGAGVDSIQVTGNGLTVDTAGLNKSIDTVITDPQGLGVTSISLSGTTTGFVGRPLVKIVDGTGSGATAIAEWDPVTQTVTGITVTAPGSNYAQPAVVVYGGGGPALTATANIDFSFGGGITKVGSGTLSLTGANNYTGTTTVKNGTLQVKYSSTVTSAATPLLTSAGGTDIQNGGVIFDYTGDTSPVTTIRGILAGSFTSGAGVMTSGQIRSSTATIKRGLGYIDNGTGNVLVKAALFGDADLDGGVSINDFNALAGNFGKTGKVWVDGDFDYDGGISINDFNLLAGNFGQTLPAGSDGFAGLLAFAAAHNDLAAFEAVTGVPEPTSLGLIAAGATLGLRRRRLTV